MAILRSLAAIFGNIFAAFLIGSPLKTMWEIKRDNSVGNRWVLNYVATYANAVCVVAYSLPSRRYSVAIINAVGVVAEFGYSCFYRHYAQGRARTIATWSIAGELLWGAAVLVGYFSAFSGGRNEDVRVNLFGILAAVTSGAMYLAMLPDTWGVLMTQNLQNQNPMLLLSGLGNCISWLIFALKPKDIYIQVSNGAGIGLTVIQTVVWVAVWFVQQQHQQPPQGEHQQPPQQHQQPPQGEHQQPPQQPPQEQHQQPPQEQQQLNIELQAIVP